MSIVCSLGRAGTLPAGRLHGAALARPGWAGVALPARPASVPGSRSLSVDIITGYFPIIAFQGCDRV